MYRILFVCHGNICRSTCAQMVFSDLVAKEALPNDFFIDSAATSTEEIGNPIYPPMAQTLKSHNIPLIAHQARRLSRSDYECFDYIIGMDSENLYYMRRILGEDLEHKIHLLMEYTQTPQALIEDPWYTRDFEKAYIDILAGCRGLLAHLR